MWSRKLPAKAIGDVDDSELSAPAAAVYVSHRSDFVDVLDDLLDQAQTLLDVTRHAESNCYNFALFKHSLEDQLTQDNKASTKAKADNSEFVSSLEAERADLAEAEKSGVAADHEVSVKAFAEEMKALSDAQRLVQTTMDLSDGEASRLEGALCRSLSASSQLW